MKQETTMSPENATRNYDIVIAGGGIAGLSLAFEIVRVHGNRFTIAIVERNASPLPDRTICFWDDTLMPSGIAADASWNTLHVAGNEMEIKGPLRDYRYQCIRAERYLDTLMQHLRKNASISWHFVDITGFSQDGHQCTTHTSQGDFISRYVFQSVQKNSAQKSLPNSVLQHFLGIEIECQEDHFLPDQATLMDFRTPQYDGTAFMYVLPFTSRKALVEFTLFSPEVLSHEDYLSEIDRYLKTHYGLNYGSYEIVRSEKGVIPMNDRLFDPNILGIGKPMGNSSIVPIGSAAAISKPTTGYTFTRILKHNRSLVAQLSDPYTVGSSDLIGSRRFAFYDRLLLRILRNEPKQGPRIFQALFEGNETDTILRFLEEKTTIWQEIPLLMSLPKAPFLRALFRK